MQCVKSS